MGLGYGKVGIVIYDEKRKARLFSARDRVVRIVYRYRLGVCA